MSLPPALLKRLAAIEHRADRRCATPVEHPSEAEHLRLWAEIRAHPIPPEPLAPALAGMTAADAVEAWRRAIAVT